MRLLSYSVDGVHGFGLLTNDRSGVVDLGARLADVAADDVAEIGTLRNTVADESS